jgi:hypothetical protein
MGEIGSESQCPIVGFSAQAMSGRFEGVIGSRVLGQWDCQERFAGGRAGVPRRVGFATTIQLYQIKDLRIAKVSLILNCMKYGYARVSTEDQNPAMQLAALKKTGCKTVFKDDSDRRARQASCPKPCRPATR